ncbi:MAG TPA: porin [Polyangiaceae bacterium]
MHLRSPLAVAVPIVLASASLVRGAAAQEPEDPPPPPAQDGRSAGYHNGTFFIRTPDDVFRLYVQGRVHVDYYAAFGPGLVNLAPGQSVAQGFSLRRARLEMAGEFFQQWQWQLGAEFAPSADDNVAATMASLACKADPKSGAESCSPQENPVDNATMKPAPTDAFVNYGPSPWANVQVGQYYVPFTLENRISDNTTSFLERALVIRTIAVPLQRDIGAMFWGESPDRLFYYAVGVFNGDGPNRPNVDTRYDLAGRAFVRPLVRSTRSSTKWAQVGVSVHGGSRDATKVGYDMPALTTSEGFTFWRPTYTDSHGRLLHTIPSAAQEAFAGDVFVPVGNFDFMSEFVYAHYDTREVVDGMQLSPFTERLGALSGWGLYAQVGYWLVGDHEILGYPSYGRPIHVDLTQPQRPAQHGLQVVARVDGLALNYSGASRGGSNDPKTPNGDIDVTSFALGVNYWATRHLRVSANYTYYDLPAHALVSSLHEVSARVGVQF